MKPQNSSPLAKEKYERMKRKQRMMITAFFLALLFGVGGYFLAKQNKPVVSLITFLVTFILFVMYTFGLEKLQAINVVRKAEVLFPDFIELVASNLRAGMTVDQALLLSSRKEFAPLDAEILKLGKDLMTGKEIATALRDMGLRIGSERIRKTIDLIVSGIIAGGNIAVLLEEVAIHMRERQYVEKKSSSNVLMYVIFIFIAVAAGAPLLFSLSVVLVKVLTSILAQVPSGDALAATKLPFTLSKVSISTEFIRYYALIFIATLDIFASMVLGMVNKGEAHDGLKYLPIILAISFGVFFLVQSFLGVILAGAFG